MIKVSQSNKKMSFFPLSLPTIRSILQALARFKIDSMLEMLNMVEKQIERIDR